MAGFKSDALTFLRNLRMRPRHTGAVLPSGRALAKLMAAQVDPTRDGPVLELGPGTGVFTKALIDRGVAPARLVLIEFNPAFVRHLRKHFPGVLVLHASAFDLAKIWHERGLPAPAAIVSGLPLLNFPVELGTTLVNQCLELLQNGGALAQFTYSQRPSVPAPAGAQVKLAGRVWRNIPPASVWRYERLTDSARVPSQAHAGTA
jgi:phosphatidylethanolamine/phosphatidyl-N-methylethanolamine N-methyltransferase